MRTRNICYRATLLHAQSTISHCTQWQSWRSSVFSRRQHLSILTAVWYADRQLYGNTKGNAKCMKYEKSHMQWGNDFQGHSESSLLNRSCYHLLSVACSNISILHCLRDIIDYLPKFNDVTWPWPRPLKGLFVSPRLILHIVNQCKKSEISSLSCSRDILGD